MTDALVIDTHPLLWYLADDQKRLSSFADDAIRDAEEGETDILIPAIVIAEAIYVGEKYALSVDIQRLSELIREEPKFLVVSLSMPILEAMARIEPRMEMHDRIIAATARVFGATVITKDRAFEGVVPTLW